GLVRGYEPAVRVELALAQARVREATAFELACARREHARAHVHARLARGRVAAQLGGARARHFDLQVDAIEQGPRDAAAIACDLFSAAGAASRRIAGPAAGAGIHRRDELEARREIGLARGARAHDMTRFERFAQHLEHAAGPLGQLAEEQHAGVRERDPARARLRTTA